MPWGLHYGAPPVPAPIGAHYGPPPDPVPLMDVSMIPATAEVIIPPVAELIFDQWTPTSIAITRTGPGASRVDVRAVRSRVVSEAGDTELSPRPEDAVSLSVANIYAPASDEYPAPLRAACLLAAAPLLAAVAALLDARDVR